MANQIENITLGRLTNYAHYDFMDVAYAYTNSMVILGEKLGTEIPVFKERLDEENNALVMSQKSELTEAISAGDAQRDSGLSGYGFVVRGFLCLRSGAQYEAARKLDQHMADYKISPDMSLAKQTGAMKNFIEDLETTYATQVSSLGLTPFVTMMKAGNKKVDENQQGRDSERAKKTKAAVLAARSATDEIYHTIVRKVNALAVIEEENAYQYNLYIDKMNTLIKRYKEQELTPKGQKGEEEGGGTSENNAGAQP